jgi:Asp-tRNA(Asn)/Glu-tRNA(Gln) amidotransferase A subunit family amidase
MHDKTLPDGRYGGLDMTSPFNLLAPCPAISLPLPVGDGMPVGLQLVGHPYRDTSLLALARDLERAFAG